jgi:hypothetical protein
LAIDLRADFLGWNSEKRQDQERFARCAAEFISLISVKETNQRKRCPPYTPPAGSWSHAGIFLIGILPHRKTAHIHVRRPPGLQMSALRIDLGESKSKSAATATAESS